MTIKTKQSFNFSTGILKQELVRNSREWSTDYSDVEILVDGGIQSYLKRKRFELTDEYLLFLDKSWTLYSGCGFLKDPAGNYIIDSFSFPFENEFREHFNKEYSSYGIQKKEHFRGILFQFTNVGYSNYYHVMTELLPRLEFFLPFKGKAKLAVSETIPSYLQEAFDLMGIEKTDLFLMNHGKEYSAEILITQPWGMNFIPERFQFLKQSLTQNVEKQEYTKRYYVSRKNESSRNVQNEEELFPVLSEFNIEVISTESMSLTKQIELFSKAGLIVGPHGAGLSNCMFMNKPKMLEIRPEHYANDCMKHLALINGATNQYTIFAENKDSEMNMYLNPINLKKALTEVLLKDY